MQCVRKVTDDLYWVGANDYRTELFENIHPIPYGVSYNSTLPSNVYLRFLSFVNRYTGKSFSFE